MTEKLKTIALEADVKGLLRARVSEPSWPHRLVFITFEQLEKFLEAGYEMTDERESDE